MQRYSYPWQYDWNLYTQIVKSLFLSLHQIIPSPDPLLSFLACDAVSHLRMGPCETRKEAVKLGQSMVQDGIISHVGRLRAFEDGPRVFRFNVRKPEDIVYRIAITRFPHKDTEFIMEEHSSSSLLAFSE